MQAGFPGAPLPLDGARVYELAALTLCVALATRARLPARWGWLTGGVLLLGTLSALGGQMPALSLKEVLLWTLLLLAAPRLAALRGGALLALGSALVVLQTIWSLEFLGFWLQTHLMGADFEPEAFTIASAFHLFGHARFLNQLQSWLLPVACLLCLRFRGPLALRALFWALLLVSWTQLWFSAGRGSMIGLAAGALVVILVAGPGGRHLALAQGAAAAGGLALYTLLFRVFGREGPFESAFERPPTTTGRTPAWEQAQEMFLESPLLGRGPQSFAWEGTRFAHPHSTPLQILAEWGALGALLFGAALVLGATALVRLRRASPRLDGASGPLRGARAPWFAALLWSSVAGLVHSLVSGVFVMPLSHLAGLVVLALWLRVSGVPAVPVRRAPALALAAALLLLAGVGVFAPDFEWPLLGPSSLFLDSEVLQGWRRPRFWSDGV